MNNKIIISLMLGIMLISICSANLGTFKQNSCVDIKTILNTSGVTLSTLSYPSGSVIVKNKAMFNQTLMTWNYTTCKTDQIGLYNYDYYDAEGNTYVNSFEISPSGFSNTLGFYFILILIAGSVTALGFWIKDGWFAAIGGLGFVLIGLYSINYGIAGMRDMFITWGVGLFMMGAGAYLAINSTLEMINENLN